MAGAAAFPVYALIALTVLAGCRAPQARTAREAPPTSHHLRQEPLRAAACIARNVDRYRSPYSAQIRPGTAPAVAEVLIRGSDTIAVAHLYTAGTASRVEIRRTTDPAFGLDELFEVMIEGC